MEVIIVPSGTALWIKHTGASLKQEARALEEWRARQHYGLGGFQYEQAQNWCAQELCLSKLCGHCS
jgi:hypothetical protein